MFSNGASPNSSSPRRGSSGSHGDSDLEEGDTEEESSSSSVQDQLSGSLSSFREKWKQELKSTSKRAPSSFVQENPSENISSMKLNIEEKAKLLFRQGIECEQSSKYYDAIQCYKNAMQLVPDIEFKIYSESKQNRRVLNQNEIQEPHKEERYTHEYENDSDIEEEEDEYDGIENLQSRFQRLLSRHNVFILAAHEPERTHFSALPMEIIIQILRWVMSRHHDTRSLDMFSLVCRGFYLCSRDSGIWRAACIQTWGLDCQSLQDSRYLSYRQMYFDRPRLETIGCYISKTSYIRHGDNSFQDRTHRPWHVVTYFRYLRFFPGGLVLLKTTADPPSSVVGSLKWRLPKDVSILSGDYKLRGDRVFIVAKQPRFNNVNARTKSSRRRVNEYEPVDQTYHLELKIEPIRRQKNMQLSWQDYSIVATNYLGLTTTNYFDTKGTKFPPFWFSRVKSYTNESDGVLNDNF